MAWKTRLVFWDYYVWLLNLLSPTNIEDHVSQTIHHKMTIIRRFYPERPVRWRPRSGLLRDHIGDPLDEESKQTNQPGPLSPSTVLVHCGAAGLPAPLWTPLQFSFNKRRTGVSHQSLISRGPGHPISQSEVMPEPAGERVTLWANQRWCLNHQVFHLERESANRNNANRFINGVEKILSYRLKVLNLWIQILPWTTGLSVVLWGCGTNCQALPGTSDSNHPKDSRNCWVTVY